MLSTRFLTDTNVLSEVVRPRPDPGVVAWFDLQPQIAVSVVTVEEIYYGLGWKPKERVRAWMDEFLALHGQILPITADLARRAGELRGALQLGGTTVAQADCLIASTAALHGLTLVTRNVDDFAGTGIRIFNPFTRSA